MPNSRLLSLLVLSVAFALGVVSCSQGTQEGDTGSLSLQLTIAGDVEIDEVAWVITGGDMPSMNGTIDTSAPGSTASIEVFGLPPSIGQDYRITMEAIGTDEETTCKGSEDFGIDIGEVTDIMVMLNCKRPQRFGSVRVNGKFNICAELTKVVVSPLQTSVGNDIDLFSAAEDLDGDNIHYLWIGTGGSFDDAEAASTTYTCTDVGDHFVKITVTDEPDSEVCDSSWTVQVKCVLGDGGTGGTGGDGGGGTGGDGTDPCVGGQCDTDSQAKTNCQDTIDACNSSVDVELTPTQCEALGREVFCTEGGTGGTGGGAGGGIGGAGGTPGVTGCDESLCAMDPDRKALCEEFIPACIVYCEGQAESCGEDECIGIALIFICNEQ